MPHAVTSITSKRVVPTRTTLFLMLFLFVQCTPSSQPEPWVSNPLSDWPSIALTNTIQFRDTTYHHLANAFLVRTPSDTFAITAKHLFLVFKQNGLTHIDLGTQFMHWHMHPKLQPDIQIEAGKLINANPTEDIGEFRTLKVRDWIAFHIQTPHPDIYPLTIRNTPLTEGEIVTAIGWAHKQATKNPSHIEMQVYKNLNDYYYVNTLTPNVDPAGRSGSPVIDKNGHLVGIVSGATGNLGVIGSVKYLNHILNQTSTNEE